MSSNEKKSVIDARIISHESDSKQEIGCFVCIIFLVIFTIVIGGKSLSVNNPEASIVAVLVAGLPTLIHAILYVGLQMRKIVLSKD